MPKTLSLPLLILTFFVNARLTSGQEDTVQYRIMLEITDSLLNRNYTGTYGVAGKMLPEPFTVKVSDNNGYPVTGFPVHFKILSEPLAGSGAAVDVITDTTDLFGKASALVRLGKQPGDYIFAADIPSVSDHHNVVFKITARKKYWVILLLAGLLGGLAFFLLGIRMLSDGLQKSAGKQMRIIFDRLTNNRISSFLVGILMTLIVQSSSATTVMLISFVNSRLLKFAQTIAIILGAAVGATITAQVIAFRISDFALLIIGISFLFYILVKKPKYHDIAYACLGFGMIFFGMQVMSQAMEPLQSMKGFVSFFAYLENPLTGILAGTVLTALIQSSTAFVGILIILATQHLLTLDAAIPLIIGASIGSCVTAVIACIGSSRESRQVAIAHTIFKASGALIMVWFIPQLAGLVESISPPVIHNALSAGTSSDVMARQIANAFTFYNLAIALLFLPFTSSFARLIIKLVPAREEKAMALKTWYLDTNILNTPSLALAVARQEILRMMQVVHRMTEDIILPFIEKKPEVLEKIKVKEIEINFLRDEINAYLVKISRQDMESALVEEAFSMMYAVNEFEQIGDILSTSLYAKAIWWCNSDFTFSNQGKEEIQNFHLKTLKLLYYAFGVFKDANRSKAKKMKIKYTDFRNLYIDFEKQHYQRLKEEVEESLDSSKTHLEVITSLKNIGSHATNIARIILKK
jgi:phosphate:Na+ symporter